MSSTFAVPFAYAVCQSYFKFTRRHDGAYSARELVSMADGDQLGVCALSLEVMSHPVTLCCGHNFERSELARWVQQKTRTLRGGRQASTGVHECPTCRKPFRELPAVNLELRQLIETFVVPAAAAVAPATLQSLNQAAQALPPVPPELPPSKRLRVQSSAGPVRPLISSEAAATAAPPEEVARDGVVPRQRTAVVEARAHEAKEVIIRVPAHQTYLQINPATAQVWQQPNLPTVFILEPASGGGDGYILRVDGPAHVPRFLALHTNRHKATRLSLTATAPGEAAVLQMRPAAVTSTARGEGAQLWEFVGQTPHGAKFLRANRYPLDRVDITIGTLTTRKPSGWEWFQLEAPTQEEKRASRAQLAVTWGLVSVPKAAKAATPAASTPGTPPGPGANSWTAAENSKLTRALKKLQTGAKVDNLGTQIAKEVHCPIIAHVLAQRCDARRGAPEWIQRILLERLERLERLRRRVEGY